MFFAFCTLSVHSQTWTETSGFGGRFTEWTVITRENWDRLRLQNIEDGFFADLLYADSFEISMGGVNRVISGTRPIFNGYYYLYGRWHHFLGGWDLVLAYGNSNTGRMEIKFTGLGSNWVNIRAGSIEYITLYDRFIRMVNGE